MTHTLTQTQTQNCEALTQFDKLLTKTMVNRGEKTTFCHLMGGFIFLSKGFLQRDWLEWVPLWKLCMKVGAHELQEQQQCAMMEWQTAAQVINEPTWLRISARTDPLDILERLNDKWTKKMHKDLFFAILEASLDWQPALSKYRSTK